MNLLYGIALSLALALPAWLLGRIIPLVGGPVFAILLGMVFAVVKRPPHFEAGLKWSAKQLLQLSIILLGFEMNLHRVIDIGQSSLAVMLVTLSTAFLGALVFSKLLRLRGKVPVLIAVGTAICGGSAIAASAPAIEADDDEIARSISTIFLFNIVAVFLFPAVGHLMGMGQRGFGLWAGTAVNDTSSVVAAGYSYGAEAGAYATIVKLTRTLFIIPVVAVLSFIHARRNAALGRKQSLIKIFPWFVAGFVLASILGTLGWVPASAGAGLSTLGKFLITAAMAAIGLRTNLKSLFASGWKPLLLGLLCWIAVAVSSLLAQALTGAW